MRSILSVPIGDNRRLGCTHTSSEVGKQQLLLSLLTSSAASSTRGSAVPAELAGKHAEAGVEISLAHSAMFSPRWVTILWRRLPYHVKVGTGLAASLASTFSALA